MCLELGIYIGHEIVKNVQIRWTTRIDGFKNLKYSQRLRDFNLFSVEGRLLVADVIKGWKIIHSKYGMCPEDIFVIARSSITRGYRFKIAYANF